MKRFISIIVAAFAFFAASAETPMVTLSHNGELSFFTKWNAFKEAVDSAKNGDILYLSEGEFTMHGGECTIRKRLNIVGNGYGSHILGNITINMDNNPNSWMDAPLFDGVRLDNLTFYTSIYSINNLREAEIRRTWIRNLMYGDAAGKSITYDKCYIEEAYFTTGAGTVMIKNSKIGNIFGGYEIIVENCNINTASYYPRTMFSSILNQETTCYTNGSHAIYNSLLRAAPSSSGVVTYGCYISDQSLLNEELEANINLIESGYLGRDGETEVGIYGGESPYSKNPSVPSVDTANSSVEYDAENNKLKVSITIKAD